MFIRDQCFNSTYAVFSGNWSEFAWSLSENCKEDTSAYVCMLYLLFLGA